MDNLKALARLVNKHKTKQIEIIGGATDASSKLYRLYEGIVSGKIESDDQALRYMYPAGHHDQADITAYQKLKLRLEDRLCTTVLLIDQNRARFNTSHIAYYNAYRSLATFRILLGRGARQAAIPLGEKVLRQALKFGITPVVMELASDLRNHFAVNEANVKKFTRYHKIVTEANELRQAELQAEAHYAQLMLKANGKRSSDLDLAGQARDFAAQLQPIREKLKSPSARFMHLYFMIRVLQFEIRNDTTEMVQVCREALQYASDRSVQVPNAFKFTFAIRLLQTHTRPEQMAEAEKLSGDCDRLVPEGSANWFLVRYVNVVLCFHWAQFDRAYQVYRRAAEHKNFSQQYLLNTERWMVIEGYMQYLIAAGQISEQAEPGLHKNFRIQRYLNDFTAFPKDKAGYNVDLIILHILLRLYKKDFDGIIANIDIWAQYASRHLTRIQSKRSKYFLKMLLRLPRFYFQKSTVSQKNKGLLNKLKEVPQTAADPEIIPFETLWEFVLNSLDNRRH